jgi:hypothetical protein
MVLLSHAYPQANRVFSGGEAMNFGIVDLSLNNATAWTSDRSVLPGYFSLLENANYIGYSDKAHIDGYIKKYGNAAFLFPVGNGRDLRTLEISKTDSTSDAFATAWIEGDPTDNIDPTAPHAGKHSVLAVAETISSVSKAGQWDWQTGEDGNLGIGTTGNGDGLLITVSIPDMSKFADESDLRLVGWNGIQWIDLSRKPTATGNKEDSRLSGTMIPGISAIAIGRTTLPTLVKIISLTANTSNCNTILKWATSIENNSSIFIIEQSEDNINFRTISSLATSGSSNGSRYAKEVPQPFGIAYYRLKIQHANGTYEYSTAISVNNTCHGLENMRVYPNPVVDNEKINLRFATSYEGSAELVIVSNTGQQVLKKYVQVKSQNNLLTIDINHLIHGAYFINIIGSNREQIGSTIQFIKQ